MFPNHAAPGIESNEKWREGELVSRREFATDGCEQIYPRHLYPIFELRLKLIYDGLAVHTRESIVRVNFQNNGLMGGEDFIELGRRLNFADANAKKKIEGNQDECASCYERDSNCFVTNAPGNDEKNREEKNGGNNVRVLIEKLSECHSCLSEW